MAGTRAEERAVYLNAAYDGNLSLRAKVDQLLAAHEAPIGFLDTMRSTPLSFLAHANFSPIILHPSWNVSD